MLKIFISLLFVFFTFSIAAEDTYVFEAKGAFAKELKALVEKYSKEGKIEAKVYTKETIEKTKSKTITESILATFNPSEAEELKHADIEEGKIAYNRTCANCHGANANKNKYASGRKLSTLTPNEIVNLLEGYKSNYEGDFGGSLRFLMKPQADTLVSDDMQSIAVYIYSLNHDKKSQSSKKTRKFTEESKAASSYLK